MIQYLEKMDSFTTPLRSMSNSRRFSQGAPEKRKNVTLFLTHSGVRTILFPENVGENVEENLFKTPTKSRNGSGDLNDPDAPIKILQKNFEEFDGVRLF